MGTTIKTNGIGTATTSHLNLTRTMADVWGAPYRNRFSQKRVIERHQTRERRNADKVAYAGANSGASS